MSDWMPRKRAEQLALAKLWIEELPKGLGMWTVTPAEISEIADWVETAQTALARAEADKGSEVANARVREEFSGLVRLMRLLHQRKFFSPPMKDSDWLRIGLKPRDMIRTPHIEVNEVVEFELKLHEIRQILVNFWVKGTAHKAKPAGYDGAVIVWAVLDAPPPDVHSRTRLFLFLKFSGFVIPYRIRNYKMTRNTKISRSQ